jgi:hypothetical protein
MGIANILAHRRRGLRWAILGASLVLPIAFCFAIPAVNWDGGATASARLLVLDAATNQPLAGATVQTRFPWGTPCVTDFSGYATISVLVGAGGKRGLLYETMEYAAIDHSVLVTLPGYEDQKVSPGSRRTISIFGIGPEPHLEVTVRMSRAHSNGK